MEVCLLGPFAVMHDGREVTVAAGRERALLALLAINANEPLSVDRIVEELWGSRGPANAAKSVQVYVSRLRKALGADRIETVGGGYLLRLGAGELDAVEFRRLAAEGRSLLDGDRNAQAERTLSAALALWRGDALADFRFEPFAQTEIRRLDEFAAATQADRADGLIALGREEEALPVLRTLIDRQPLWERPRRQLMLALYRTGRQAEALEVYRTTRALLIEELAVEPSPELQELERLILTQDPALRARRAVVPLDRRRRAGGLALVTGGSLIAIAAAIAVIATRHHPTATLTSIAPNSLAAIDPAHNRLVAQLSLGSSPTAVTVAGDSVVVADAARQQLLVVDPHRLRIVHTFPLPSIPTELASSSNVVWVAEPFGADSGTLTYVDLLAKKTRDVTIRRGFVADLFAPSMPDTIAIDALGRAWTDTVHHRLVRVQQSPTSYGVGSGHSIDALAFGAGSIWVASGADDTVLRVDPADGRVVRVIPISGVRGHASGPAAIAYGNGSVWVADALDDRVTRIDPASQSVVATITVGRRPTAVVAGMGAIWVLNAGDGSVSRVDPNTDHVVATIEVAHIVTGLATGHGRIWATVAGGNAPQSKPPPSPARPLTTGSCAPIESGGASPDLLIVSDLPLFDNGSAANAEILDMRKAIAAVLQAHHFRAGSFRVGYQACTDSSPAANLDPSVCAANARAFAADASLVGVIGTFQSLCSGIELPILNRAPSGPVAMISPANTYVGLTHNGPRTGPDEPERYYPTGVRNYVRLASPDDGQGAALAQLAQRLHRHRLFLLDDGDPTSEAMVSYVSRASHHLGIDVAGTAHWTARGPYVALARTIRAAHADAVVLTGCICTNGGELITGLREGLGANVPFLASDNFTCTCDMGGPDAPVGAYGMYVTTAGTPASRLSPAARRFLRGVLPGRNLTDISNAVPIAAAATDVLLQAIATSDGTRASIVEQLTHERVGATPIGGVSFDANGDPSSAPFGVYRVSRQAPPVSHIPTGGLIVDQVIEADPGLAAP